MINDVPFALHPILWRSGDDPLLNEKSPDGEITEELWSRLKEEYTDEGEISLDELLIRERVQHFH